MPRKTVWRERGGPHESGGLTVKRLARGMVPHPE